MITPRTDVKCLFRKIRSCYLLYRRSLHQTISKRENGEPSTQSDLIDLCGNWPEKEVASFIKDMQVIPDFISEDEELKLCEEIEPYLKRQRYEKDSWDEAIHGFRETERKHWYPENRAVLNRVRQAAFCDQVMPYVHVLDLAEDGVINPHVDSIRYCGTTISGISLLTDCVMRLVRVNETKHDAAARNNTENYRSQPKASVENNFYADILLKRRSLYIMRHTSRYDFTHEILANAVSQFRGQPIRKGRRISIICRNEPKDA